MCGPRVRFYISGTPARAASGSATLPTPTIATLEPVDGLCASDASVTDMSEPDARARLHELVAALPRLEPPLPLALVHSLIKVLAPLVAEGNVFTGTDSGAGTSSVHAPTAELDAVRALAALAASGAPVPSAEPPPPPAPPASALAPRDPHAPLAEILAGAQPSGPWFAEVLAQSLEVRSRKSRPTTRRRRASPPRSARCPLAASCLREAGTRRQRRRTPSRTSSRAAETRGVRHWARRMATGLRRRRLLALPRAARPCVRLTKGAPRMAFFRASAARRNITRACRVLVARRSTLRTVITPARNASSFSAIIRAQIVRCSLSSQARRAGCRSLCSPPNRPNSDSDFGPPPSTEHRPSTDHAPASDYSMFLTRPLVSSFALIVVVVPSLSTNPSDTIPPLNTYSAYSIPYMTNLHCACGLLTLFFSTNQSSFGGAW